MPLQPIQALLFSALLLMHSINYAHGQHRKDNSYIINGTIKGIDSGKILMLNSSGTSVLDSAVIVNGKFFMQGKVDMAERLLFRAFPGNWNFRAFVENASINLYIDTTGARYQGSDKDKWALIWDIEERGSQMAKVYSQYINETGQKNFPSIQSSVHKKLKEAKGNKEAEAKLMGEMDSITKQVLAKQKTWIENYIKQYPSSIAGTYIFHEFFSNYQYQLSLPADVVLAYLNSILDMFSGPAKSSVYHKELANEAAKLSNIQTGSLAPDFTLLKTDKTTFTLSSTRGNYTLIDFWASWCIPCRKAIPEWKEVYAKYKDKGFTIVGVSTDRNWNDWIKALGKEQMPWEQVIDEFPNESDPALVKGLFGTNSLPYYVLLDKEGFVLLASGDKDLIIKKIEAIFP